MIRLTELTCKYYYTYYTAFGLNFSGELQRRNFNIGTLLSYMNYLTIRLLLILSAKGGVQLLRAPLLVGDAKIITNSLSNAARFKNYVVSGVQWIYLRMQIELNNLKHITTHTTSRATRYCEIRLFFSCSVFTWQEHRLYTLWTCVQHYTFTGNFAKCLLL